MSAAHDKTGTGASRRGIDFAAAVVLATAGLSISAAAFIVYAPATMATADRIVDPHIEAVRAAPAPQRLRDIHFS